MSDRSAAGGGSAERDKFLFRLSLHFHYLIALPGSDLFIGFCAQFTELILGFVGDTSRRKRITKLHLVRVPENQTGLRVDGYGYPPEMYQYDCETKRWEEGMPKLNPEATIQFLDRTVVNGLPITVVPLPNLSDHFVLVTNKSLYFFKVTQTARSPYGELEMFHQIDASAIDAELFKSCSVSADGRQLVVHHTSGLTFYKLTASFGRIIFEGSDPVMRPKQSDYTVAASQGDERRILMTPNGEVIFYHPETYYGQKRIELLLPGIDPAAAIVFVFEDLRIPVTTPFKDWILCQISPTKFGIVMRTRNSELMLLILDVGTHELKFGQLLDLWSTRNFMIQQICTCSSNPMNFFVGGVTKKIEKSSEVLGNKYSSTPCLLKFSIDPASGSLVIIQENEPKFGPECNFITSTGGKTVANFSGDSIYSRSDTLFITEPPITSQQVHQTQPSILNGVPINSPPNSVFALLPDGTLVSSNPDNGLTLFGPNGKPVASTDKQAAHKLQITSIFPLEVGGKLYVLSYSHSDCSIKIWSIQKRGETVRLQIVATVSIEDIAPKKGVKFLALYGQTLLIVTNQQEFLRFHIEITGGIIAKIRPIPGQVVQMESGQICQGIADLNSTHALFHVMNPKDRSCSLVLVSFVEGDEVFKTLGTRESKEGKPASKPPAVLTRNGFAVSAVDPNTICSTPLAPDRPFNSVTPQDLKDGKLCNATILKIIFFGEDGFICITENGYLIRFVYDAQQKPIVKGMIVISTCALTPKCRIQVSGNTAMVCLPRDDGSFELLTFRF
jgi:hypothetical protein